MACRLRHTPVPSPPGPTAGHRDLPRCDVRSLFSWSEAALAASLLQSNNDAIFLLTDKAKLLNGLRVSNERAIFLKSATSPKRETLSLIAFTLFPEATERQ